MKHTHVYTPENMGCSLNQIFTYSFINSMDYIFNMRICKISAKYNPIEYDCVFYWIIFYSILG